MIRLGYQMPVFDYPGVATGDLFEAVVAQAQAAEASGFDTVLAMDHFYQLPMLGPPDARMLECYTLLSGIAARTSSVRLSALVTGNTYRNPTLLAKTVTTLDVVSSGRAICGMGAGWFELEHDQLGFEFGTFTDRFEKLEEALEIITAMFRDERPTLAGKHYQVESAINQPSPVQPDGIPVMIGGAGEKKTLRLVAQYANESNLICTPDEIPRKMDALAVHCDALGRDRAEIGVSFLGTVMIAPTSAEAEGVRNAMLAERGLSWADLDDAMRRDLTARIFMGDPDTVAERVQTELVDQGITGLTLNMPANGHDPEIVALAGQTLAPLFA